MHSLCPVYVHTQSYLIACILYINGQSLIFHVCIHTLKNHQLTLSQPGAQDPRWSQKHHKKSWISKPASKATKAMTVAPKATQNHEKNSLGNSRNPIYAKVVFLQHFHCQEFVFAIPDTQTEAPSRPNDNHERHHLASRSQRASGPSNRSEPKVLKPCVHT